MSERDPIAAWEREAARSLEASRRRRELGPRRDEPSRLRVWLFVLAALLVAAVVLVVGHIATARALTL